MADENDISEKDIEVALRYLKYHDPENATREMAIALLHDLKSGVHSIAQHNPDLLLELQKELDQQQD